MSAVPKIADSVEQAIGELEQTFEDVRATPTGNGGAELTVMQLPIGQRWTPVVIDLTFDVAFNYPHAPIYPYYATPDLNRVDGGEWPTALQKVEWRGSRRTQISLRANRWNPRVDTAVGAVLQVQRWFENVS